MDNAVRDLLKSATDAAAVKFARTRVESQRRLSNGGQRAKDLGDLHNVQWLRRSGLPM